MIPIADLPKKAKCHFKALSLHLDNPRHCDAPLRWPHNPVSTSATLT
jgi:hypothetical protein